MRRDFYFIDAWIRPKDIKDKRDQSFVCEYFIFIRMITLASHDGNQFASYSIPVNMRGTSTTQTLAHTKIAFLVLDV